MTRAIREREVGRLIPRHVAAELVGPSQQRRGDDLAPEQLLVELTPGRGHSRSLEP